MVPSSARPGPKRSVTWRLYFGCSLWFGMLVKNPTFTIVAVLDSGSGLVGQQLLFYSIVNAGVAAVLFRSRPRSSCKDSTFNNPSA